MSQNEFTLKCSDSNFIARQKNTFTALSEIEKKTYNRQEPMEIEEKHERTNPKIQKSQTKTFRGKESIFKTPQNPVPKNFIKKIPDFKKNPHKWTKYTLDDVRDEDISDKANTKAALSFLKELENRNINEEENSPDTMADRKIMFRRPTCNAIPTEETGDKPSFRSSKIVMPEYVVGQKIKKERKNKKQKTNKINSSLKLDHLYEEDHDE